MSNKRLGRGFDSLIPQNFDNSILSSEEERIRKLATDVLMANPEQPRVHFDEDELKGLAQSIKEHGILQPLVVTPNGDKYYIIAGERRWRAAKKAGLTTVPVVVRTTEQLERLELALVENVQRVNLSPLEQAASIQALHEQFNLEWEAIANRLGKAPVTVRNTARLMGLPEVAKRALAEKQITEGHARAVLSLANEKDQIKLLEQIIKNGWSVRQAERYVVAHREGATSVVSAKKRVATSSPQTRKLSETLKAPVTLKRTAKGGRLEIVFKSDADLKRIIALMSKSK